MTRAVDGNVCGRRKRILRFGPESDSVRYDWIVVRSFHGVARMNRYQRMAEAHYGEGVRAAPCGYHLAPANGHAVF